MQNKTHNGKHGKNGIGKRQRQEREEISDLKALLEEYDNSRIVECKHKHKHHKHNNKHKNKNKIKIKNKTKNNKNNNDSTCLLSRIHIPFASQLRTRLQQIADTLAEANSAVFDAHPSPLAYVTIVSLAHNLKANGEQACDEPLRGIKTRLAVGTRWLRKVRKVFPQLVEVYGAINGEPSSSGGGGGDGNANSTQERRRTRRRKVIIQESNKQQQKQQQRHQGYRSRKQATTTTTKKNKKKKRPTLSQLQSLLRSVSSGPDSDSLVCVYVCVCVHVCTLYLIYIHMCVCVCRRLLRCKKWIF